MAISRAERKAWARESFIGLQNILVPSFTPDLLALDEAGIRRDVRQSIRHGFFASLLACEAALTLQECRRFVEIVADEAGDQLLIGVSLFVDGEQEMRELLAHAEKVGADFALLGFPLYYHPADEDAVYRYVSEFCEASNLGIIFPANKQRLDLTRLHPSGVPLGLFDRLAAIDNLISIQIDSVETGLISECFMRYGEKLPLTSSFLGMTPLLMDTWGMQWSGGWMYEALQTPEQPHAVELFELLRRGRYDEAMRLFWHLAPGMATWGHIHELFSPGGNDHMQLRKYYQWCVGGNGGWLREPHFNLFQRQKDAIREAYQAMGITPTQDAEELFAVGRSYYGSVSPDTRKAFSR